MSERVLIVDDEPVQRRLLEAMVQRFGYQAVVADGGDAALKLLRSDQRIDCVVTKDSGEAGGFAAKAGAAAAVLSHLLAKARDNDGIVSSAKLNRGLFADLR